MSTAQRQLDKFEQLVSDALYSCVILGNPELTDFELLDVGRGVKSDVADGIRRRNLGFLGCCGIMQDGRPRLALDVELDPSTIAFVAQEFCKRVERGMDWLERLGTHGH